MDIAALSIALATSKTQASASVAVAGKVKDLVEQNGENIIKLMETTNVTEQSVNPDLGGNIDVRL